MSLRSRLSSIGIYVLALTTLFPTNLSAQQPKVLAPHHPIAPPVAHPTPVQLPAMPRSMVGGLWMTDTNFKSSIHIKNDLETSQLTVTPLLILKQR